MHTYKYLYNKERDELPSMEKGLQERINAAKTVLKQLHTVPFQDRDDVRERAVLDAIKHNTELLKGDL